MIAESGALASSALRVLTTLSALVIGSALVLWALSGPLADVIGPTVGVSDEQMAALLAISALFLATLGLSGILGSVALIRGHRFLPALAPAFPSVLGALYLVVVDTPAVTTTFAAIALGGLIQTVAVGVAAVVPRFSVVSGTPLRIGRLASLTATILLLMGLIAPLQRILAAGLDPAGAAQFDYAARGMQVALQLLLGGLVIAVLPDWTTKHSQSTDIRPQVIFTAVAAILLLVTSGGIALVAASPIVSLVYERGAFTASDTSSVVLLVRILVPGFVAEGVWLVLAQALLATGRTDIVLRVWTLRFVIVLVLTTLLGLAWGAIGVAVAYSLAGVAATSVAGRYAATLGLLHGGAPLIRRAVAAGLVISLVALALLAVAAWIPPVPAAVMVIGVAGLTVYSLRLVEPFVATVRGHRPPVVEADS
jgi:putative peptidoglycan lipid II flippase